MAELVLKLRDLPEGVSRHGFRVASRWLSEQLVDVEGVDAGPEDGLVEVEATKQGRKVLLRGEVSATLSLTCVRCLRPFAAAVEADLDVLLRPGAPRGREEPEELGIDDLGEEVYQGDEIVLDDLVRDLLLLEVPMNPACGEGCPGWDSLTGEAGKE